MGIVTYQQMPEGEAERAGFVSYVVERHRASAMYRTAATADEYYRQRNVTVNAYVKTLFGADGGRFEDFTASRLRIASNLFKRLNVQRCMYSLGNGVAFADDPSLKERMGEGFDDAVRQAGMWALVHGLSFMMWNLDRVEVFPLTQFAPVWDEFTGELRAGVRFWRLDSESPLNAVLYEEDGYTEYREGAGGLESAEGKKAYVTTYAQAPADPAPVLLMSSNYGSLPIVPVWGGDARQSTLVGMRYAIDAYDLIKSGLVNDVQDCAEVYWIVENAGGMSDKDLQRMRDRLLLTHIATADTEDGGRITPYRNEVPYQAREATLQRLRDDIYQDFGALDVHVIAAGATNDHIDAAYQPLNEEASEFERHIRNAVRALLKVQGADDSPLFRREKISNVKEQVDTVLMEAEYLDRETVLRKLPNVDPEEVPTILQRLDGEESAMVMGGE